MSAYYLRGTCVRKGNRLLVFVIAARFCGQLPRPVT